MVRRTNKRLVETDLYSGCKVGFVGGDGLVSASKFTEECRLQRPQFREDKRGRGYSNDTPKSWVHGKNGDATTRPGFDHSPKRGGERR